MLPRHLIELLLGLYSYAGAGESLKIFSLSDDVVTSLLRRSLASAFSGALDDESISKLASALECYDPWMHRSETPGSSTLCRVMFERFREQSPDNTLIFEEFDRCFRQFTSALSRSLEQVAEPQLMDTPCREFGELDVDQLSHMQAPGELSGYMIGLARYLADMGVIMSPDADHVEALVGKMASAPGYLRFLSKEKKYAEIVWLLGLMRGLRSPGMMPGPAVDDLKVSLGLLLFNIRPSEKVASCLTSLRPSNASAALLYHYNAVLALNHLLIGRYRLASAYAARALQMTANESMKAYVGILQGCIAIRQSDYGRAIGLLNEASARAPAGRMKGLIAFYRGTIFFERREYANAIVCFEAAGASVTDPLDRVTVHNNIGSCAMYLGDLHRAEAEFLAMDKLAGQLNGQLARKCQLAASSYIGAISRALGDNARAIERYRNALKLAISTKDERAIANQLGNLGTAYARAGDMVRAHKLLDSCMTYSERMGYWPGIRFAYWHTCRLLMENGNRAEARKFSDAYVSRYPELKDLYL
ncbi:MAG: Tetratricopeptide repeat protein [Methanocella sp. PtaU1.Bin125]|nr:MAG: Tetratricopeptide repeat protein [Methanocella sp. PtaU1.Bin125]